MMRGSNLLFYALISPSALQIRTALEPRFIREKKKTFIIHTSIYIFYRETTISAVTVPAIMDQCFGSYDWLLISWSMSMYFLTRDTSAVLLSRNKVFLS